MLERRFLLYFLAPMLVLAVGSVFTIYSLVETRLEEQAVARLVSSAGALRDSLQARVRVIQSDLMVMRANRSLDDYFQFTYFDQTDSASRNLIVFEDTIVSVAAAKPIYHAIRLVDSHGRGLVGVLNGKRDYHLFEAANEPWFERALVESAGSTHSTWLESRDEKDRFLIATPVVYQGEARGVLVVETFFDDLAVDLASMPAIGKSAFACLVSSDGRVVVDGRKTTGGSPVLPTSVHSLVMGETGVALGSVEDGSTSMHVARLSNVIADLDLVVAIPSTEIFAPVYELRALVLPLAAIGFLLISVVGSVLVRRVVSPVRRLTAVARTIAEGDLEAPIEVHTGDEIEELATSLSRMTGSLKKHIEQAQITARREERRADELRHAYEELVKMKDLLVQTEKMASLGQLAGGVAHDFNNLLTAIGGYAELLIGTLPADSEDEQSARYILEASSRAADLVSQLLAFARREPTRSIPVELEPIVSEVINVLEHTVDPGIAIIADLKAPGATVLGDPSQLHGALLNLGINARDAMPEGGTLTFSTRQAELNMQQCVELNGPIQPGCFLEIRVSDTGSGMSDDVRERIFEPFFTTKEIGQGTGLGLSAVYGRVIAHRGAVSVESKLGHGTTIAIYLPLNEGEMTGVGTRVEDSPASLIRGSGRVLIVDDDEIVRHLLRDMLRSLGYDAVTACDGPEFLTAFRRDHERIDLVIIDLIMPKMNGREVLAELRRINPDIPALITSGFDLEAETFDLDMNDEHRGFLQKPFTALELSRIVAAALEQGDTGRSVKDTLSRFRSG